MATRKRAPSKGSPKIRFVQIAASAGPRGRSLYGLTKTGEVYTYSGLGKWTHLPAAQVLEGKVHLIANDFDTEKS